MVALVTRRYARVYEYQRRKRLGPLVNKSVANFVASALAVHKVVIVDSVACLFGSGHLLPGSSGPPRATLIANTFKLYVAHVPTALTKTCRDALWLTPSCDRVRVSTGVST